MSGLLLVAGAFAWLAIAILAGALVKRVVGKGWIAKPSAIVVGGLLAFAPFFDQFFLGPSQFEKFCSRYPAYWTSRPNMQFRNLEVREFVEIEIAASNPPAKIQIRRFSPVSETEIVRSIAAVYQKDGWVLRWLELGGERRCYSEEIKDVERSGLGVLSDSRAVEKNQKHIKLISSEDRLSQLINEYLQ